MFIKIEGLDKEPMLVNAETIRIITEHETPETTFCRIHFDTEDASLDTLNTLMMLESLLDANSVEKQIARLKYENTMECIRQSTQDAIAEACKCCPDESWHEDARRRGENR